MHETHRAEQLNGKVFNFLYSKGIVVVCLEKVVRRHSVDGEAEKNVPVDCERVEQSNNGLYALWVALLKCSQRVNFQLGSVSVALNVANDLDGTSLAAHSLTIFAQ